jgi:hypothetical protein
MELLTSTSAEQFQQCAEFLPFRNRALGPLTVTVSPVPLARRVAGYRLRRRAIDSAVDVVGLGCGITPAVQGALLHGTSMLPAFG